MAVLEYAMRQRKANTTCQEWFELAVVLDKLLRDPKSDLKAQGKQIARELKNEAVEKATALGRAEGQQRAAAPETQAQREERYRATAAAARRREASQSDAAHPDNRRGGGSGSALRAGGGGGAARAPQPRSHFNEVFEQGRHVEAVVRQAHARKTETGKQFEDELFPAHASRCAPAAWRPLGARLAPACRPLGARLPPACACAC